MDCEPEQTLPYFALIARVFLRLSVLSHPRRQRTQPVHTCCRPPKSEGPNDRDLQSGFFLKTQVLSQSRAEYNSYILQNTQRSVAPKPGSTYAHQLQMTNLRLYHHLGSIYQESHLHLRLTWLQ